MNLIFKPIPFISITISIIKYTSSRFYILFPLTIILITILIIANSWTMIQTILKHSFINITTYKMKYTISMIISIMIITFKFHSL